MSHFLRSWKRMLPLEGSITFNNCLQRFMHTGPNKQGEPSCSRFVLSDLPAHLQEEFDESSTAYALRTVLEKRPLEQMRISSNWILPVGWKCRTCKNIWWASAAERTAVPSSSDCRCPFCVAHLNPVNREDHSHRIRVDKEKESTAKKQEGASSSLKKCFPVLASTLICSDTCADSLTHVAHGKALDIQLDSQQQMRWKCGLCCRIWSEPVRARVHRYEAHAKDSVEDPLTPLCPECQSSRSLASLVSSPKERVVHQTKHFLSDDPALLSEVRLRPHQNPRTIALQAETLLNWHCSYCQYDYLASIRHRSKLREGCPRCSGKQQPSSHSFLIQRPDAAKDLSVDISSERARFLTVNSDSQVSFVCHQCHTPYRMSCRTRCLIPEGCTACPKCFLLLSQALSAPSEELPRVSKKRIRKRLMNSKNMVRRLSQKTRSRDSLVIAHHMLKKKDSMLIN